MNFSAFSEVNINKKGPNLSSKAKTIFKKRVSVFGINVVATEKVGDLKLLHAAHVMAEYLDNNQDGIGDDPKVIANMLKRKAISIAYKIQVIRKAYFRDSLICVCIQNI